MVPRRVLHEWLLPGGDMQPWIDALRAIDRRGEGAALVTLLKSDAPLPDEARWHLADLLERYQLKRRRGGRGGRRTPSYDFTYMVAQLLAAEKSVRTAEKAGEPRDDAVDRIAPIYGVKKEPLHKVLEGKHSSTRLQKRRRPPSSPSRP